MIEQVTQHTNGNRDINFKLNLMKNLFFCKLEDRIVHHRIVRERIEQLLL